MAGPMILVLRALGLGDLLTAVPALRAIRRARPDDEIVLAAPAALAPLIRRIAAVDTHLAVAYAPVALPPLPAVPDLAIDLHGDSPQSTEALRTVGAPRLWAYGEKDAPAWVSDDHEVDRWCRLVAAHGCPADPADLCLPGSRVDRAPLAVIHPGATDKARRWPAGRFAVVAQGLAELGLGVQIIEGPDEPGLAHAVARLARLDSTVVVEGIDLGALADLVSRSSLVVSGDTGVAHLATACRTPSVVLFGPQSPGRWGPPAHERIHRSLWYRSERRPQADQPHPALLRIQPLDVLTAADDVLHGLSVRA